MRDQLFALFVILVVVTASLLLLDWLKERWQRRHDWPGNEYLQIRQRELDRETIAKMCDQKEAKRGPSGFEAQGERRRVVGRIEKFGNRKVN